MARRTAASFTSNGASGGQGHALAKLPRARGAPFGGGLAAAGSLDAAGAADSTESLATGATGSAALAVLKGRDSGRAVLVCGAVDIGGGEDAHATSTATQRLPAITRDVTTIAANYCSQ